MDLVVLANPKSGRGIASRLALDLRDAARRRGHRCKLLEVGGSEHLDPAKLGHADALAVVGGDGTVNRSARAAIEAGAPIYQLPTGNENLFARALGMRRSPSAMLDAMERGPVGMADVGIAGDDEFLIMGSIGPDAGVIRRVARNRRRAIGHLAYVEPVIREFFSPAIPVLTVEVDGRRVVDGQRGVLIAANTREYASRLDPCRDASMFSGRLHVIFMPAETSLDVVRWGVRAWRRRARSHAGAVGVIGRRVRVMHEPGAPIQIDGEWHAPTLSDRETEFGVCAARLPVLVAPECARVHAAGTSADPQQNRDDLASVCEIR